MTAVIIDHNLHSSSENSGCGHGGQIDGNVRKDQAAQASDGHTLATARKLLPDWIEQSTGAIRVLVARCNMCIVRCNFDSGIIGVLLKLRQDIGDHASTEPRDHATCKVFLDILALIQPGNQELNGKQFQSTQCLGSTQSNCTIKNNTGIQHTLTSKLAQKATYCFQLVELTERSISFFSGFVSCTPGAGYCKTHVNHLFYTMLLQMSLAPGFLVRNLSSVMRYEAQRGVQKKAL